MPNSRPDAQTVAAIHAANQALADRIEKKIENIAKEGNEQTRRIYERFDRHEQAEGQVFREFTAALSGLQTEIKQHSTEIREARGERSGLWKWIIGASAASGGATGFIAKLFDNHGP